MINIIGGKFKRKKINVPNTYVRPTSAIKRQAIFSILESYAIKNSFDLYKEVRRCDNHPIEYDLPDPVVC